MFTFESTDYPPEVLYFCGPAQNPKANWNEKQALEASNRLEDSQPLREGFRIASAEGSDKRANSTSKPSASYSADSASAGRALRLEDSKSELSIWFVESAPPYKGSAVPKRISGKDEAQRRAASPHVPSSLELPVIDYTRDLSYSTNWPSDCGSVYCSTDRSGFSNPPVREYSICAEAAASTQSLTGATTTPISANEFETIQPNDRTTNRTTNAERSIPNDADLLLPTEDAIVVRPEATPSKSLSCTHSALNRRAEAVSIQSCVSASNAQSFVNYQDAGLVVEEASPGPRLACDDIRRDRAETVESRRNPSSVRAEDPNSVSFRAEDSNSVAGFRAEDSNSAAFVQRIRTLVLSCRGSEVFCSKTKCE